MKIKESEKKARLEFWRELYESALLSCSELFSALSRHMEQYLGSDEIDGSSERAKTVRNITYEIIESEISPDVPEPKTDAQYYSEKHERNARMIERLCSSVKSSQPFESYNDVDERYTYIYGASVWYVEWDDEKREDGRGGIRIHTLPPNSFIPQPNVYEVEDMEYCFLKFSTTAGELVRKYGVSPEQLSLAEREYEIEGGDGLSDTVTVVTVFYRDEQGEIGKFVFTGALTLADIPEFYKRKIRVCRNCSKTESSCRCGAPLFESESLDYETVVLDGESITLPYYTPKHFPIVIRKNTIGSLSHLGGSDCEKIRPQQQAINKIESRILEKLLRAGVTPVMPEGASITPSNAVFGQVIRTRPGESLQSYGKIDTTPDLSQDIAEADRLYDMAKRVLGISDALQGLDTTTAESGYARELKISRATSRLETKKRIKYLVYSKIYELVFEHYLAFSDEVRHTSYKDALGKIQPVEFNRLDFIEWGEDGYYYNDGYLFSVDLNSGSEYSREALWEKNLANLESGTLGDKTNPLTLLRYWQSQERAHYPFARENVEYFTSLIEKEKENENE